MTDRARIDLADLQAELLIPDSSNRNRRRVAGESLKRFPRDPVVLYAYIASHIRDATQWSTPDGHRTRYPWTLGRALASAFDLLAQPSAATGAIRTALSRVGNVAAALLALEDRPDAASLEQAGRRLDAYRALGDRPLCDHEKADWFPDSQYRAARGRLRAWQAVLKSPREADEDFAFLPDYLEARDLRWAFDPLVLLPEFQHWALQRIHREREAQGARPARASAAIEFDCVESYRNHATVSDKQMPALIVGRLLAALVVGRPNLLSNAWRLSQFKLPCSAACLRALFAAGLDPNASLKDGHTLLQHAIEKNDLAAVQAYLDAGAGAGSSAAPVEVASARGIGSAMELLRSSSTA
ncbi:hypothetical protein [Lysobacter capsici]|uniref:hypothetical protein n=1 Tax=Lysobacter capsici TaxID=435897 RepID=UPI001C0016AE|nr:hypothetical protein [Lysobacter capsici]QWF15526.1 hypothetical protein KME82_17275 [Lysobacter capsici]